MRQTFNIAHDAAAEVITDAVHLPRRLIATAMAAYDRWIAQRNHRRDMVLLQSMSDRKLADIGLSRSKVGYGVQFGRHGN